MGQWHSVKEELPDKSGWAVVARSTTQDGTLIPTCAYFFSRSNSDQSWRRKLDNKFVLIAGERMAVIPDALYWRKILSPAGKQWSSTGEEQS